MAHLRLIVGLGNPGLRHRETRHNIGFRFVQFMAGRFGISLAPANRFQGWTGRGALGGLKVRFLLPDTYMNASGEAVAPFARYYRIAPEEILVACDEVAFAPGQVRLKTGGGANGHRGVQSVIDSLGSADFHRLRIGVGHPGHKDLMLPYLTSEAMPQAARDQAETAYRWNDALFEALVRGDLQEVMNQVHKPG